MLSAEDREGSRESKKDWARLRSAKSQSHTLIQKTEAARQKGKKQDLNLNRYATIKSANAKAQEAGASAFHRKNTAKRD